MSKSTPPSATEIHWARYAFSSRVLPILDNSQSSNNTASINPTPPSAVVFEHGLIDATASHRASGSISFTAPLGIYRLSVASMAMSISDVRGLARSPVRIQTASGVLTLTAGEIVESSEVGSPLVCSITYTYELLHAVNHKQLNYSDRVKLGLQDYLFNKVEGFLNIQVMDDVPTVSVVGTVWVTEDGVSTQVGNVLTGVASGADTPATFRQWLSTNTAAVAQLGRYGTLVLGNDGAWSYQLDNSLPATQELTEDTSLQFTLYYAVEDADYSVAVGSISIGIRGSFDKQPVACSITSSTQGSPIPTDSTGYLRGHLGLITVEGGENLESVSARFYWPYGGMDYPTFSNEHFTVSLRSSASTASAPINQSAYRAIRCNGGHQDVPSINEYASFWYNNANSPILRIDGADAVQSGRFDGDDFWIEHTVGVELYAKRGSTAKVVVVFDDGLNVSGIRVKDTGIHIPDEMSTFELSAKCTSWEFVTPTDQGIYSSYRYVRVEATVFYTVGITIGGDRTVLTGKETFGVDSVVGKDSVDAISPTNDFVSRLGRYIFYSASDGIPFSKAIWDVSARGDMPGSAITAHSWAYVPDSTICHSDTLTPTGYNAVLSLHLHNRSAGPLFRTTPENSVRIRDGGLFECSFYPNREAVLTNSFPILGNQVWGLVTQQTYHSEASLQNPTNVYPPETISISQGSVEFEEDYVPFATGRDIVKAFRIDHTKMEMDRPTWSITDVPRITVTFGRRDSE